MQFLAIAKIGAPHGLNGELKVTTFDESGANLRENSNVFITEGLVKGSYDILSIRGSGSRLYIKLQGIESSEKARELTGSFLCAPKEKCVPPDDGEFFVNDLLDCCLHYNGEVVAKVISVWEAPTGFMFEVEKIDGSKAHVPFLDRFVDTVDPLKKIIVLRNDWILG